MAAGCGLGFLIGALVSCSQIIGSTMGYVTVMFLVVLNVMCVMSVPMMFVAMIGVSRVMFH